MGDDGGGDTGDDSGRQRHPHLGDVTHLGRLGADGVPDLLRRVTLVIPIGIDTKGSRRYMYVHTSSYANKSRQNDERNQQESVESVGSKKRNKTPLELMIGERSSQN